MRQTPRLVFWSRGIAACVAFGVSLLYCSARVIMRLGLATIARDTARVMHRFVCPVLGISTRVVGAERLALGVPCIYIANHQSYLDYPVLARVLPARTIIVGKNEMQRIPIVGWLFRATGNEFIARDDSRAARLKLEQLALRMREGYSVWMFPEGTRRTTSDAMLPFRSGAFRLAAMTDAPLVPVVVSSLKPEVDLRRRRLEPKTLTISVLPALLVPAGEGAVEGTQAVAYASMSECYRSSS